MRRWAAILAVLLTVAATTPAQAQGVSPPLRGPAQPDAGPVAGAPSSVPTAAKPGVTARAPTTAAPVPAYMSPPPILASRPPADPLGSTRNTALAQCKSTCGRDYYQCLAGESAVDCPSTWGQCVTSCGLNARKSSTLSPLGNP